MVSFFTLWDRLGGSYRDPSHYAGEGVHDQVEAHLKALSGSTMLANAVETGNQVGEEDYKTK